MTYKDRQYFNVNSSCCNDHKKSASNIDVCASMPVSDLFNNPDAQDRLIVSRQFTSPHSCGKPNVMCQVVSVTREQLANFINESIDLCSLTQNDTDFGQLCFNN